MATTETSVLDPAAAPAAASRPLSREFSLYLDLTRFLAALVVLLNHTNNERALIPHRLPFGRFGHEAVVVFFVLSGFVIAHVTEKKERSLKEYWASRISRIYTVAVPALLLPIVLDTIGEMLSPAFYAHRTTHGLWYVRVPASLTFLNEIWGLSITPWSNSPWWSLAYEWWYYTIFAIAFFLRGRTRIVLLVLVCALLGPKVLLLAPIWWMGVALHRWRGWERWPEWLGWAAIAGSIAAVWAIIRLDVFTALGDAVKGWVGPEVFRTLAFSDLFLTDWLLGGAVVLNFLGVRRVAHRLGAPLRAMATPIRAASGYTFSIYIFHQPLLYFLIVLIPGRPGYAHFAVVVAAMLLSLWLLGRLTEQRRAPVRRAILSFFDGFAVWPTNRAWSAGLNEPARE